MGLYLLLARPHSRSITGHRTTQTMKFLFSLLITFVCTSCSFLPPFQAQKSAVVSTNPPSTYRVVPGDTLYSIAWRYGFKYEELAKYNSISKPYIIKPGQVIRLDLASAKTRLPGNKNLNSRLTNKTQASYPRKKNSTKLSPETKLSPVVDAAPQWRWPAQGALLSSFQGSNGLNKGIDIGGKLGEPVLAAASGQVVYAGSGLRGYGKLLIIKHNETFLSAYAHNHRLLVQEGDLVKVGQRIADMGSSGTNRVKLHFEIRREGVPVNPLHYLPRR